MKLVKFLMRLKNETVTIELKNGTSITGSVVSVDMSMNVHMKNITQTLKLGKPEKFDSISIRGSGVRYILLPDALPLDTLLQEDKPKVRIVDKDLPGADRKNKKSAERGRISARGRGRGR